MSAYLRLINGIESVAVGIIPNVKVFTGTVDQISREGVDNDQPMIGIQEGFKMFQEEVASNSKTGTIFIDFGLKDDPDSTSEQTLNIVSSIDVLVDQFLERLESLYEVYGIEISKITRAPFYKKTASVFSGMMVQFAFSIGGCDENILPSLSDYQEYVGMNVSPYEWKGITQRGS